MSAEDKWREFTKQQGLPPLEESLLRQAFSHPSFVREQGLPPHASNQRLEFLGDAVLDMVMAEHLYGELPSAPEGELTQRKAALVRKGTLARVARRLGLGELLLVGRGEEETGGREKTSLLADALEALIGALYLAGGWALAQDFVLRQFADYLQREWAGADFDYKTQLQELVQSYAKQPPLYHTTAAGGPPHSRVYSAVVSFGGQELGGGEGPSKRAAEQVAARQALERKAQWEPQLAACAAGGEEDAAL